MTAPIPTAPPIPPLSSAFTVDSELSRPTPALFIAEWARDVMLTIADTTPRSLQRSVGPSEIGQVCQRRVAYRLAGTPAINLTDPAKSMVGIGVHGTLAEGLARLDSQRYLVEHRVTYRGVVGNADLYDRRKRRLIDWKTTSNYRLTRYRREGVPPTYLTQLDIYAAALEAEGLPVDLMALVFIPRDGTLDQVYVWAGPPDRKRADDALDRYFALRERIEAGEHPADITPWPSSLCTYCPNYSPTASDLDAACPGEDAP